MSQSCKGQCLFGQCPFPHCIKGSGARRKAQTVTQTMDIETGFSLSGIHCRDSGYGIAIDIGTTTVAAVLLDLATGEVLGTESTVNPQISFGPDVISRIQYCRQFGPADPHNAIVQKLNEMIAALKGDRVLTRLVLTGNTTMLCLAANTDPSPMGIYPFTPPSLFGRELPGREIGLEVDCTVYITPCMGPFVGGDITTAVLAASLTENGPALLADIGTNGELALFVDGKLYSTSTAAGPAFEGASIRQGMAAIPGAICRVEMADNGLKLSTIADAVPKGICGSGLISAVYTLLKNDTIDETGLLKEETYPLAENVALCRQDVREIQMAKAAICAGILALCHQADIEIDNIPRFCIAGGFGSHIDPVEAAGIGLFPPALLRHTNAIGNAALGGAAMVLLDSSLQKTVEALAFSARVLDLATDEVFMDEYINQMMFE